jgi:hypothetical protein
MKNHQRQRFVPHEQGYSTWLVCPVCLVNYTEGFFERYAGSRCGDLSKGQKEPCVGRLIPADDFERADWILPSEVSDESQDPRRKIRRG